MYRYLANFTPDSNGTVLVTFPDVPEAITFGEDEEDACRRGAEALEAALSMYMDQGLDIPKPAQRTAGGRTIGLPALSDAKVCLYTAMRKAGITKAELARRLGWRKSQVGRLLDLEHDSRMDQIEAAFRVLGKRIEFRVA
jgi:antitoxin HicB